MYKTFISHEVLHSRSMNRFFEEFLEYLVFYQDVLDLFRS